MSKITWGAAAGSIPPGLIVAMILSTLASAADLNQPSNTNISSRPTARTPDRPDVPRPFGREVLRTGGGPSPTATRPFGPGAASGPGAMVQPVTVPPSQPASPVRLSSASLTRAMPFREAVDILRHSTTPPVNIVVLWRDIGENAGVYRDTPIGFDGVPGLSVGQCLDLLTASLSAGAPAKLGCVVRNGAVVVATIDNLPAPPMMTRVYDVSDLVTEPARYFLSPFGFGGMGYGGGMMGPAGGYSPGASYLPGNSYGGTRSRPSRYPSR